MRSPFRLLSFARAAQQLCIPVIPPPKITTTVSACPSSFRSFSPFASQFHGLGVYDGNKKFAWDLFIRDEVTRNTFRYSNMRECRQWWKRHIGARTGFGKNSSPICLNGVVRIFVTTKDPSASCKLPWCLLIAFIPILFNVCLGFRWGSTVPYCQTEVDRNSENCRQGSKIPWERWVMPVDVSKEKKVHKEMLALEGCYNCQELSRLFRWQPRKATLIEQWISALTQTSKKNEISERMAVQGGTHVWHWVVVGSNTCSSFEWMPWKLDGI